MPTKMCCKKCGWEVISPAVGPLVLPDHFLFLHCPKCDSEEVERTSATFLEAVNPANAAVRVYWVGRLMFRSFTNQEKD